MAGLLTAIFKHFSREREYSQCIHAGPEGTLTRKTCLKMVDMCLNTLPPHILNNWKEKYTFQKTSDCLRMAPILSKRMAGQSVEWKYSNKLTGKLVETFRQSVVLFPSNVLNKEPDKKTVEGVSHILENSGLMKSGEKVDEVLNGFIFDYHKSTSGKRELVIVYLDNHSSDEVQTQITNAVEVLNKRGIYLVNAENVKDGRRVSGRYTLFQGCSRNNSAKNMIACELGADVFVRGTEDLELFKTGNEKFSSSIQSFMEVSAKWDEEKACEGLKDFQAGLKIAYERSDIIALNTLSAMKDMKKDASVLIIGAKHLDVNLLFQEKDVNYIIVAVPSLVNIQRDKMDKFLTVSDFFEYNNLECR